MTTTAEALIRQWWVEKTWSDNIERQAIARRLIDYYNGEQLDYLTLVLEAQFADPKALKLQKGLDNIVQMIADRISRIFDQPPTMTCENAAGQALLDLLTKDGKFALTLKTGEVYANLTGVAALHPWFDDKRGIIKTKLLPSCALWAIQNEDDPTEADAIIYSQSQRNSVSESLTTTYTYWDDQTTRRFDAGGVDVIPSAPNVYGILPFSFLRDQVPVDAFFGEIGEVLYTAQDTLNIMLTELNQLIKMQSFSQPVFVGLSDPKSPVAVDPSKPLKLPSTLKDETQPDFKFVSPQARIVELMEAIKTHVERTASRYDIHLEILGRSGAVVSGYALKLSEAGLNRRREDGLPLAREALQRWWEIVKRINNYHGVGAQVPEDAELVVDFAEPTYDDDPATIADLDQKRIDQGVISPLDIIKRDNPELDDDAALAVYQKNMSFKQTMSRRFGLADVLQQRPQQIGQPSASGATGERVQP